MPKINQEEYEVLKNLDDKWKWIAMDRDSYYAEFYQVRPYKTNTVWLWDGHTKVDEIKNENLFQFIKWEDEVPYNIAELIEEYERELYIKQVLEFYEEGFRNVREAFIKFGATFNKESEETEVKKVIEKYEDYADFLEEQIEVGQQNYYNTNFREGELKGIRKLLNELNQLEVETLSPEWIDENLVYVDVNGKTEAFLNEYRVRNLLVPKQEEVNQAYKDGYEKGKEHATKITKPVIPQFVADYIKQKKKTGHSLLDSLQLSNLAARDNDSIREWLGTDDELAGDHRNQELFAKAWLDGYEIEEEQKYYAKVKGFKDEVWNSYITIHSEGIPEFTGVDNAEVFSIEEWSELGINEDNADFELVKEVEE